MEQNKSRDVGPQEKGSFPEPKVLMLPVNIIFDYEDDEADSSRDEEQCLSGDISDLQFSSENEDGNEDSTFEKRSPSSNEAMSSTSTMEFTMTEEEEEKDEDKRTAQLSHNIVSRENVLIANSVTKKTDQVTDAKRHVRFPMKTMPHWEEDVKMNTWRAGKYSVVRKDYYCLECSYRSSNSYNLKLHERTHTDERPYACPKCRASFRTQSHLNRHITHVDCSARLQRVDGQPQKCVVRQRRGEVAELRCESCDYSTAQSYNMKVHQRIHTDERPYRCDICDAAFRTSSHLHRHTRNHQRAAQPKPTPVALVFPRTPTPDAPAVPCASTPDTHTVPRAPTPEAPAVPRTPAPEALAVPRTYTPV
ncbi:zinc finger protein 572 [Esox lucius]|uniref:C2H2-type domain-containing protein n=1 Tax=Esox lucius TaxID=8010 RepID=A0AAY5K5U2_ESOLU|nr:zinc finger protein 572 [Esox lucius]XP_019911629.2 zinc finger protein 572 [Esox lucius]XP_019911630.2 zinc finger protein 572 [Esox lucius]